MTLCLAMSAFASNDVNTYDGGAKSINAENLLTGLGFTGFETSPDYSIKPQENTIGAVAAHKTIYADGKQYTLIALAIRGAGYEREWSGNFNVGSSGHHAGFEIAANKVMNFYDEYIRKNQITGDFKLWITGFSRAGGTANLVAGAINTSIDMFGSYNPYNSKLVSKDLYAYTFEAPAGATRTSAPNAKGDIHNNIFNIVNPNDIVPRVAPESEGFYFRRYGKDMRIPTGSIYASYIPEEMKMLARYNSLERKPSSPYNIDTFRMKRVSLSGILDDFNNPTPQHIFLDYFITMLSKDVFKNRENYVSQYQTSIQAVLYTFFGEDDLTDTIMGKITNNWREFLNDLPPYTPNIITIPFWLHSTYNNARNRVAGWVTESLNELGLTGYTQSDFNNAIDSLLGLLVRIAVQDTNSLTTLVMNLDRIGTGHYPELCLAWMQSMDSKYTAGGVPSFASGSGTYRTARINCPVDIEVYNEYNVLVAKIISDIPQDVGSSIITAINENGEKVVYLPADSEYKIVMTATENGLMTYSLSEYNPNVGDITRLVNYYEVPLASGMNFEADIPIFSEDELYDANLAYSTTEYTLSDSTGIIIPDDDLSGESATQSYFMVDAYSDNIEHGYVMGNGYRQLGSFAKVSAVPFDDFVFEGWYINNIKVSSDSEYRFLVDDDIMLTAKFTKVTISISVPDLSYNGTFTYNTINFLVEGGFPNSVYVEINKYDVMNSKPVTVLATVNINNLGIGVWSPGSLSVQMDAPGDYIEIIVYEDSTCQKQYNKLIVHPTVFEFN